jgi:dienelactone hydrolase
MSRATLAVATVWALAGLGATGLNTGSHAGPPRRSVSPRFAVGEEQITFVDPTRTISVAGQPKRPRALTTIIRYPAPGPAGRMDVAGAAPDRAAGPFPLIVFGHGFAVTPATYFRLLRAWAQAGYVVAAPVFPLENAHAPGGPDEADLVNQPRDMSVVISGMLTASHAAHTLLHGMIAPRRIAVSGQSDGGETALAVAYDRPYRDPRVRAAVILSGAQIPSGGTLLPGPPLLATQGTADTVNQPRNTYAVFDGAHRPKYLLRLLGAPHLPPYTVQQPQLTIVERVTTAFLDRYLKGARDGLARMRVAGDRRGVALLDAAP